MVGERLRRARKEVRLSLAQVAAKAKISIATLSRIENDKQGLDIEVFLLLASILGHKPADLLGDENESIDPLINKLSVLAGRDRIRFWTQMKESAGTRRAAGIREIAIQVEELVAQIDYLRCEVEAVRKRLNPTRPK